MSVFLRSLRSFTITNQYVHLCPKEKRHDDRIAQICGLTSVSAVSLSNWRQSRASSVDEHGLERAEVCISLDPGLRVHPWHHFLEESNLVCLAVLQHELSDPEILTATRMGLLQVRHEVGSRIVGIPLELVLASILYPVGLTCASHCYTG